MVEAAVLLLYYDDVESVSLRKETRGEYPVWVQRTLHMSFGDGCITGAVGSPARSFRNYIVHRRSATTLSSTRYTILVLPDPVLTVIYLPTPDK